MWIEFLHIVVVGFLGGIYCHIARVSIVRLSGYIPLFAVLVAGALGAWFGQLFLDALELIFEALSDSSADKDGAGIVRDSVIPANVSVGFVIVMCVGLAINRRLPVDEVRRYVSQVEGALLELLLQGSVEDQFLVELTMENDKTYIGQAYDSGIQAPGKGDVTLIPFISGYRHGVTKTLRLTTFYHEALRDFAHSDDSPLKLTDFHVVLPKNQIRSARRFDLDVYLKAFAKDERSPEDDDDPEGARDTCLAPATPA